MQVMVCFRHQNCEMLIERIPPLLRWAGGKRQLLSRLMEFIPPDFRKGTYREPFLGGACLFFALQPQRAVLSDANAYLISCYQHVRDNWFVVNQSLKRHARLTSKSHYYKTRTLYNNSTSHSALQAARFIYLNKTCFNGIFRVNTKGEFNVPYGWKEPPALPDAEVLERASKALKHAHLVSGEYDEVLKQAKAGDFVYLDPPYPPLNGTAYFTHYTMNRFTQSDQEKLSSVVRHLDELGCRVLMTSADIPLIRRLYRGFNIRSLHVTRFVTCKAVRHTVREVVITNY
jgi:DNA adenine methylase